MCTFTCWREGIREPHRVLSERANNHYNFLLPAVATLVIRVPRALLVRGEGSTIKRLFRARGEGAAVKIEGTDAGNARA